LLRNPTIGLVVRCARAASGHAAAAPPTSDMNSRRFTRSPRRRWRAASRALRGQGCGLDRREKSQLDTPSREEGAGAHEESVETLARESREGRIDLAAGLDI